MDHPYEAPAVQELGSLAEFTQQKLNKDGFTPDFTSMDPNIVGSLVPAGP